MKRSKTTSADPEALESGIIEDFRAVLFPREKWHYLFHLVVVLVGLSYWVGSLLKLPEASWAEMVMYRPKGDNQVYPVITALSRLNFGDPTDAFNYGKGVAGFHAIILLPHALAVAILGWPGYMVADALFFWAYFVAISLLLRRCQLGALSSLVVASALATGSLQNVASKLSLSLLKLVGMFDEELSDWHFPNLVNLHIFDTRIPRPMITEIFVVLILYCLLKAWRQSGLLNVRAGLILGALMGILAQGDPYSFSALGLVLLATVTRNMAANRWRFPWHFALALGASALVVGSYFLYQLAFQNPDAAVRFGLAIYPRSQLMPLPGYAPLLRVAVVILFAGIILLVTRKSPSPPLQNPAADSVRESRSDPGGPSTSGASLVPSQDSNAERATVLMRSAAQFCIVMVTAAWLAQPVQLFLLGKGAQIYHYLAFTLPCFYSYAMVIMILQIAIHARLLRPGASHGSLSPPWARSALLGCLLAGEILLGFELSFEAIKNPVTARQEATPWAQAGVRYRPAFRALDNAFRKEPALREARTFATFNHEVNFLLTGFHDKRAFLPDNGFTTLPDRELERRLFEMAKICQLHPKNQFTSFIQNHVVMNFWLGCAKYWFATDHSYAPLSNYSAPQLEELKKMGRQASFSLAIPPSELGRLAGEYTALIFHESDVSQYPDLIITSIVLKDLGVVPHPSLYAEVYKNEVFWVYRRTRADGAFSASPAASTP